MDACTRFLTSQVSAPLFLQLNITWQLGNNLDYKKKMALYNQKMQLERALVRSGPQWNNLKIIPVCFKDHSVMLFHFSVNIFHWKHPFGRIVTVAVKAGGMPQGLREHSYRKNRSRLKKGSVGTKGVGYNNWEALIYNFSSKRGFLGGVI